MKCVLLIFCSLFLFWGGSFAQGPKKEIRAVWLTTIYGLDWPRFNATDPISAQAQQNALCDLLDRLQEANFNTVFFQTRLRGDVLYRSAIEPAAKVFTGKYGRMPVYDPLAFVIGECHKRGMECHVWFVTFPVGSDKVVAEQGRRSVVKRYPKLCKRHKGEWYLDPAVPGTADYLLSLVKEIVENYDLDGIHFDYIRYPEQAKTFPDQLAYNKSGKKLSLAEWRRENINRIVYRIYDYVKSVKPWVQVSASPLGKYSRIPKVPNAGWTAYESVFQDPQHWLQAGKLDMVVPMMYYKYQNFFPFLDNWVEHANGRLVVPGLGAYRLKREEGDWVINDLTDQIDYARYYGGAGCAFFRSGNLLQNEKGIYDILKQDYYACPAQLPALEWLDNRIPAAPREIRVEKSDGGLRLSWQKPLQESEDLTYTVYYAPSDSICYDTPRSILTTGIRDTILYWPVDTLKEQEFTFSVSASTRYHIESAPSAETYYYLSRFLK